MKPDLEAIRARAEKASPGPWENRHKWSYDGEHRLVADFDSDSVIASGEGSYVYNKADAEFTANARQDIPALLAHIEALERVRGAAVEAHEALEPMGHYSNLCDRIAAALAAVDTK